MTTTYSFPLLKIGELLQKLVSLFPDLRITESDLRNPKAQKTQLIYKNMLQALQIDVESMPVFQAFDRIDFEYLLEESYPLIAFLRIMQTNLSRIGINDFCLQDLIAPDPKRTRRVLNCFCNFLLFVSVRSATCSDIALKAESHKTKSTELESKIATLEEKLKVKQAKQAEFLQQKQKLTKNLEGKLREMEQMKSCKIDMQKEFTKIKATHAELSNKLDHDGIKNLMNINEEWGGQILKSPEKAKATIEVLKQEVENLEQEKDSSYKRISEMQQHIKKSKVLHVDLQHTSVLLDEERDAIKTRTELKTKVQKAKNQKLLLSSKLQDTKVENADVERKMKIQAEGKSQTVVQFKAKLTSLRKSLEQIKSEFQDIEHRQNLDEIKLDKLMQEVKISKTEGEKTKSSTRARHEWMKERKEDVIEIVKEYGKKISLKLEENKAKYDGMLSKKNKN